MKAKLYLILMLTFSLSGNLFSQDFSDSWIGYFSYNQIIDISFGSNTVYAGSTNAAFSYENDTNTLVKLSTVNGLSGENVSTSHFSEAYGVHVLGYENGLLEIIQEGEDVLTEVDIVDKQTIQPNQKRINHIYEYNGIAYLSTDFGIVEYNLENLEFGDTFFIGANGAQIKVNQVTVFDDMIYAATQSSRVKVAPVNDPNLIDFNVWSTISAFGNIPWIGIEGNGTRLFAAGANDILYELASGVVTVFQNYAEDIVDLRSVNGSIILTTTNRVFIYDSSMAITHIINRVDVVDFDSEFTCATLINNNVYVGTQEDGVLEISMADLTLASSKKPDGPLLNRVFSIETPSNEIWAVFGGYSGTYGFSGGVRRSGISRFKDDAWVNIPYDSISGVEYLSHITVNPNDTNQAFISSYWAGLQEINNNEVGVLYDDTNSALDAFAGAFNLTLDGTYDNDGALWVLNGRVDNALARFDNGQWSGFSFSNIIDPPNANLGFSSIVIDDNGNKYIGSYRFGLIGFNETQGVIRNLTDNPQTGNLPDLNVSAVALDNNNNLWIGTIQGLRVLFNASQLITGNNPQTQPIIILEEGVAKELLFEQVITDIVVDGANNKWISTATSGVFYFSPDGQETIFHFTNDNSALPSNNVLDMDIDETNGNVYFATDKGLVAYRSGGSNAAQNLEEVFVYPNPVRPEYRILGFSDLKDINLGVKIKGLTENVNIKITDVEGNLVAEGQSNRTLRFASGLNLGVDGGTAIWNGKNFSGNIVASGVYLILISDLDSLETTVKKVMIVR